jgi:YggT family protein
VRDLLCLIVDLYVIVIILRAVLSFFPLASGSPMTKVAMVLRAMTDPILIPLRRVIPPIGAFDLSPLLLLIGLRVIVKGLILGC